MSDPLPLPLYSAAQVRDLDARLIAAAPDLLEALERYATRYLRDERDDPTLCVDANQHADVLACFAAIAKAKGEGS